MRAFFRNLLRRDVTVTVSITPGCVVRPGDAVLISTEYHDPAALQAALSNFIPDGARVLVMARSSDVVANLSRLLEQSLDKLADDGADDEQPEPAQPVQGAPNGQQHGAQDSLAAVDDIAIGVLSERAIPEPTQESIPHSEASK